MSQHTHNNMLGVFGNVLGSFGSVWERGDVLGTFKVSGNVSERLEAAWNV